MLYGCKVNQYETHSMMQRFKEAGYGIVGFEDKADIYVVNTCTVTNISDRKSRQMIRRVKQINPKAILCVVGCYAQVAKEELVKMKEIDIILGTNDRKDILSYIRQYEEKKNPMTAVTDVKKQKEYIDWGEIALTDKARVEIKIQDGCDRYCTYCIIPYARGPVRSRKMQEIIQEVKQVVQTGIKEVVITGIHISSYGKDFQKMDKEKIESTVIDLKDTKSIGLIDLLEELNKIENLQRIRLGSLEPGIITEDFVSRIKKLDKVCNHFHLSLQSGCDETLKRMNRRYLTQEFRKKVELLRYNIPEVALTTDIIVGFPGETQEEFAQTFQFLKEIQFSKMHIFKYSPRKGTPAATYPNQVDGKEKEKRSHTLLNLSNANEEKFAKQYLGKEIEVLFENVKEGHTTNYIKVISKDKREEMLVQKVVPIDYDENCLIC